MRYANTTIGILFTLSLACGGEPGEATEQTAIEPVCSSGAKPTITPEAASAVIDGDTATSYGRGFTDWQSVTIDLGCAKYLSGFRRYMRRNESSSSRVDQGESWQYSTDGIKWSDLTGSTTFGWQGYVNYGERQHAWHSVSYGWSRWLRPNSTTVKARYIRYSWDGNFDSVAEVQVDLRTITTERPAIEATSAWNVIDASVSTGLTTGYLNWQWVTIDLGRTVRLSRMRRSMTGSGANRGPQGEGWATSVDGVTFTNIVASEVTGWEAYNNYLAHAWHSLPYGWSAWLELKSPKTVRYVRFRWDGNSDRLNEIETEEVSAGADASYDFSWTDGSFSDSVPDYGAMLSPLFPPPTTWDIISDPSVGFSGFYEGEINSNVVGAQNSRVAVTLMQSSGGEIRGVIHFVEGHTQVYLSGFGCSNKTIPAGTRLAVHMNPWTNDGRFTDIGSPPWYQNLYASGSTSRDVGGFGFSGTATFNFYAQLWNKGLGSGAPASFLSVYIEYDTPCSDGPALYLYLTRNNSVLRSMVGL